MKFVTSVAAAAFSLACFAALPMDAMAAGQSETPDGVVQPNYQIIS